MPLDQRFMNMVSVDYETGCWLWTGSKNQKGYGCIAFNGKNVKAHKLSFEKFYHAVPSELTLDHVCRHRACVQSGASQAVDKPRQHNGWRGNRPSERCKNTL
jgi:hypothetical protein